MARRSYGSKSPVTNRNHPSHGRTVNFLQALLAVVLGNVTYFWLAPSFPPTARHRAFHFDLGMALDFWFCLVAYGLIRTARRWK